MECECVLWRHSSELQIFRFFCCRERDVIWIINSNGSVNLRTCQIINDDRGNMQLKYERILCCETQRQSTHHRITGVSFCGITQSTLAFLYNSGRIAFYQLVSCFQFKNFKSFLYFWKKKEKEKIRVLWNCTR